MMIAVVLCAPMGFVCIEAGWMVTEIGRQPWVIYGILRTADAVTPMPGLVVPFVTFTALRSPATADHARDRRRQHCGQDHVDH